MKLKFKNGKIRILQVSDAQDMHFIRRTMFRMLDKAYDTLNPDLIVLTGDNILGNHLCDARFGTKKVIHDKEGEAAVMKTAIDYLVAPIEKRGIPFAMIYGNHDDMNRLTKEEQAEFYRAYKGCLGLDDSESPDVDTYNLPVYSEDGEKVKFNLWLMASAWRNHEEDKTTELVKPEAVEWYKKKSAELKEANGGEVVPSIMFQHIPLVETLELIEECPEGILNSVKGPDGKFYKLKADCKGELGEYPCTVEEKTGQFEAIKECGDVKAIVFGHDHCNRFMGNIDGIDIIQTSCASFRCYGTRYRGVRVFDINEDGTYSTQSYTYEEIMGSGVLNELAYIWDADEMWKKKTALIAGCAIGVAGLTALGVKAVRKLKG